MFQISISVSLVGIPIGISSSTVELKICAIIAAIKKYKSIIKKKKNETWQDSIVSKNHKSTIKGYLNCKGYK